MRIFLDTNVILDVLAKRDPWFTDSATVLSLLDSEEVEGFAAAHSITNLFYLTRKHLGQRHASEALLNLLSILAVAPVDQDSILKALALGWPDFEDALQMVCATNSHVDYLVSRNKADFESTSLPIVTPAELLTLLRSSS